MNIADLSKQQRLAMLDLLVLAMYMDGSLASVETIRVQQLLVAMGLETDYDRNREFDASINRVRQFSESPEAARACAGKLAANFTTRDHQQRVLVVLNDLMGSDGSISPGESTFLSVVKEVFKLNQ
jgi:uncharacterized tellurite resistance protein B-like protein